MIECMRLIIGEVWTRERERVGLKVGRSLIQNDLGGREGTAVVAGDTKMKAAALQLTVESPRALSAKGVSFGEWGKGRWGLRGSFFFSSPSPSLFFPFPFSSLLVLVLGLGFLSISIILSRKVDCDVG